MAMSDISEKDLKVLISQAAEELGALLKSEPVEKAYQSDGSEANPANVDVSDEKPMDAAPDMQADPSEGFEGSGSDSSGSSSSGSDSSSSSSSSDSSSSSGSSSSGSSADIDESASEEELEEAYCDLSDEDLRSHYEAVKKAVFKRMGGQGDVGMGGEVADAAPIAPPASAPTAAPSPAPEAPLAQSEKEINMKKNANAGGEAIEREVKPKDHNKDPVGAPGMQKEESSMSKEESEELSKAGSSTPETSSEAKSALGKDEIEAEVKRAGVGETKGVQSGGSGRLEEVGKGKGTGSKDRLVEIGKGVEKAEIEELRGQVEQLTKALELIVNRPERKAVTSLQEFRLNKNENTDLKKVDVSTLSKAEIHNKLIELSKSDKLDLNERDLVNRYYVGSLSAEALSGILSK